MRTVTRPIIALTFGLTLTLTLLLEASPAQANDPASRPPMTTPDQAIAPALNYPAALDNGYPHLTTFIDNRDPNQDQAPGIFGVFAPTNVAVMAETI